MFILRDLKRAKYRNVKTEVDGELFDSKLEANDYQDFKLLLAAGEISNLRRQVPFEFTITISRPGPYPEIQSKMVYIADFTFDEKGNPKPVAFDSKGHETKEFKFKWRHAKRLYPEWEFRKTLKNSRRR